MFSKEAYRNTVAFAYKMMGGVPGHVELAHTAECCLCVVRRLGGISHMQCPQAGHIETHFRLLRQDGIAPLAKAVCKFKEMGGLGALQQHTQTQQQVGLHQ